MSGDGVAMRDRAPFKPAPTKAKSGFEPGGLVSAHNDARRRDGQPRDGEFAAVEPYPPRRSRLLLHLLTILKSI